MAQNHIILRGSLTAAEKEEMGMRKDDDNELCTLRWENINRPPSDNLLVWRDAVRHHNALILLARQAARRAVGPQAAAIAIDAYLKKNRARLMAEAAERIAQSPELARWRLGR
jgi:hypothetical protein